MDAEQSHRQTAVNIISRHVARQLNTPDKKAFLYNTYQMYLRKAPETLNRDMEDARALGYVLAAKVVRGAYLNAEWQREQSFGVNILQDSKHDTDQAYDRAVAAVLQNVPATATSSMGEAGAALVVATHNTGSVQSAVNKMQSMGLLPSHPRVHFAQIMGMSNHITIALATAGYNAHKLILYGQFSEILPWLRRRLDECQVSIFFIYILWLLQVLHFGDIKTEIMSFISILIFTGPFRINARGSKAANAGN